MRTIAHWALPPLAALLLAGCGDAGDKAATDRAAAAAPSGQTLAAAIRADDPTMARMMTNAGLETALDGEAPYTMFAPPQAALADFADPPMKAESAALLRAHLAPGAVTRADIGAAIDRAGAEGAKIRTMAGDLLTFTRDGQDIVVTASDGARARLTGAEDLVSNGVVQPVDGLLVKPSAAPG